jgi:hypothetical protein
MQQGSAKRFVVGRGALFFDELFNPPRWKSGLKKARKSNFQTREIEKIIDLIEESWGLLSSRFADTLGTLCLSW